MRPRVTPAAVVLTVSLGVLVAVPLGWAWHASADATVGSVPAGAAPDVPDAPADRGIPPSAESPDPGPEADPLPARPVGLSVPALGAVAPVVPVGVDPDGQVVLPGSGGVLGWYRFGPRPGEPSGSAVVVGHRDTVAEGPGVLFDLPDLRPGDRIDVTLADGRTVVYRVAALESIAKQRLPLERLFARTGDPRLTVITCGGAYLPDVGGYQENVVVTAVPVRGG
jgi:sortase (surface protein transpeptidase)